MDWTRTQVLSFAPDSGTATRGEAIATTLKWPVLERNTRAIWGECKGSGAKNYKTGVDLQRLAFKCSCPSRKFPCKHSIALMLIFVSESTAFSTKEKNPVWLEEWLLGRDQKEAQTKTLASATETQQKSEALKEKNWQTRLRLMDKGIIDVDIWLLDLIRQGLAQTQGQDYAFWNGMATRMVDAKLGGLAKRIKALQLIQGTTADWPTRMLSELSEIYLLSTGFKQREDLPDGLKKELFSVAGVNIKKEILLSQKGLMDTWTVVGQIEGVEENLNFRRTWLKGSKTKRYALLLDFSFGDAGYTKHWKVASIFTGEIVFYPSSFPLRAVVKSIDLKEESLDDLQGEKHIEIFMDTYAEALSLNPWISNFPCCLEAVIPAIQNDDLYLVDQQKNKIVVNKNNATWKLMSISGGYPITVFGEWSGERLIVLSATVGMRFVDLNS